MDLALIITNVKIVVQFSVTVALKVEVVFQEKENALIVTGKLNVTENRINLIV
ncbi:MAG: hypothetical protein PHR06_07725 [Candidatus Cloacimonetes bacterium]|nr:hypothetical protein [Candidatus Cloacimonadota bacterium]